MTTLKERIEKLPEARRKKVAERAQALVAEETRLQDLREARSKPQAAPKPNTDPFDSHSG